MLKKYLFIPLVLLFTGGLFTSCDEVQTLPFNIPISLDFALSTSNTSETDEMDFCLDDNAEYQQYQEDLQNVDYLEASLRTTRVSPADIECDITVTITDASGVQLATFTAVDVNPADYSTTPLTLAYTQAQISAINAYLNTLTNQCFNITLEVENISGSTTPYEVDGVVDVLFSAEAEVNN